MLPHLTQLLKTLTWAALPLSCIVASFAAGNTEPPPLSLCPENPHYFLFRGKPTILITSGEHYGAVLNLDFDCVRYLDALHKDGLNLTRVWSGSYREVPGSFSISDNTLAPLPNRFICPWARSGTPGSVDGGDKFDLIQWNPAYFKRLKAFLTVASARGVVVEVNLFCPFYEEEMWHASPMNAANNINAIGTCPRDEVYTLKHPDLLTIQDAMTRKIVSELRDFDNVYYEVCNEPYFGGVTMDWQSHMVGVIQETERDFPHKHLISMNIANGSERITDPVPGVSIFNFHYATPPDTVAENYGLNKVIGDNETGFRGSADVLYRSEGWAFILAGGGLYNNLDYSFSVAHPDGTFMHYKSPGGGSPALRRQLQILKEFIERFDFVRMAPDNAALTGPLPDGVTARVLAEAGKQYAIYVQGGTQTNLDLTLPAGKYAVEWRDTKIGKVAGHKMLVHPGGDAMFKSPTYSEDIALSLRRVSHNEH